MKAIYCDVCRNQIPEIIINRTFFPVGHFEICEECRDNLESAVKNTVREKKPFDYAWFDDLKMKVLEQAVDKGHIESPKRR
ncbi:MAG: hypothetical protein NT080_13485 [Spirochaetes bacterium]|nr:hypothetical protein [Spirochaetota bacterium]